MDWSKHALLVIDVQNDFLNDIPDIDTFQTSIQRLLRFCRARKILVVHIRSFFNACGSDWMVFAKIRGSSPCVRGTAGSMSPEWAQPLITEVVLEKRRFDAFLDTDLYRVLERHGIRHIFVCGLVTSICVNITALSAMQRGFVTTVLSDCVSDDADEHERTLRYYGEFAYGVIHSGSIEHEYERIESDIRTVDYQASRVPNDACTEN